MRCWEAKGGCAVPTCAAGPNSRKHLMRSGVSPEKLKPCPVCAEMIPEHAQRCRYCGEFTDRSKRSPGVRHRVAVKTSNLAGISLILGILSGIIISLTRSGALFLLTLSLPLACIGIGIWALVDIKAAQGNKTGFWTAIFGISIGCIDLLYWLVTMISNL